MNNVGAYIHIGKIKFMTSMVYRFEFFASIFASGAIIFSTVFLWKAVYHSLTKVDGLSEDQMITYAILSALLGIIFNVSVERSMFERILQGDIAIDFIRPTDILLSYLAEDMGIAVSFLISKFIPMFLLISLLIYKPVSTGPVSLILFIVSSILSYMILWLLSALTGILYMKFYDLGNVGFVKDAIIALLSGSIIPIWFFPQRIKNVLGFLPFQYTYQAPLGIFIGKYSVYEAVVSILIQAVWICMISLGLIYIWNRFSKNVLIQGG